MGTQMLLKLTFALVTALLVATPAIAAPNGTWKITIKSSSASFNNFWGVRATIKNNQLSLREGSCETMEVSDTQIKGNCKLNTGDCGPNGTIKLTLKFDGNRIKGTARGRCRGLFNYSAFVSG